MSKQNQIVFILDDDVSICKALSRLIKLNGYSVETFGNAQEFLAQQNLKHPSCLILDVCLQAANGFDVWKELSSRNISIPVIFITAHGDIPMGVKAIKGGAIDFLPKPFSQEELLGAVKHAIAKDIQHQSEQKKINKLKRQLELLTPRETEVLQWVITGSLNKQIAQALGTAEKTIKVHRGRIMNKLNTFSVANLVRFAQKVGINPA